MWGHPDRGNSIKNESKFGKYRVPSWILENSTWTKHKIHIGKYFGLLGGLESNLQGITKLRNLHLNLFPKNIKPAYEL